MSGPQDREARVAAIVRAQAKVARALAELEAATDCEVVSVRLNDIDVTSMSDEIPQRIRTVEIDLRRRPGTEWATYPHLEID